jgi:hypothetical protein
MRLGNLKPLRKLLDLFTARCSLVNEVLCLDVQKTAFSTLSEIEGRATEVTQSKQRLLLLMEIALESKPDDLCNI